MKVFLILCAILQCYLQLILGSKQFYEATAVLQTAVEYLLPKNSVTLLVSSDIFRLN